MPSPTRRRAASAGLGVGEPGALGPGADVPQQPAPVGARELGLAGAPVRSATSRLCRRRRSRGCRAGWRRSRARAGPRATSRGHRRRPGAASRRRAGRACHPRSTATRCWTRGRAGLVVLLGGALGRRLGERRDGQLEDRAVGGQQPLGAGQEGLELGDVGPVAVVGVAGGACSQSPKTVIRAMAPMATGLLRQTSPPVRWRASSFSKPMATASMAKKPIRTTTRLARAPARSRRCSAAARTPTPWRRGSGSASTRGVLAQHATVVEGVTDPPAHPAAERPVEEREQPDRADEAQLWPGLRRAGSSSCGRSSAARAGTRGCGGSGSAAAAATAAARTPPARSGPACRCPCWCRWWPSSGGSGPARARTPARRHAAMATPSTASWAGSRHQMAT